MTSPTLNLRTISVLIVDANQYSANIVCKILRGFGLAQYAIAVSGAAAKEKLSKEHFDLTICEAALADMKGSHLVHWLRHSDDARLKFMPVLLLSGITDRRNVALARDCGANLVVKKPLSPAVLFDRLVWAAQTSRPFVETDVYVGPDRRFKMNSKVDGETRRRTDPAGRVPDIPSTEGLNGEDNSMTARKVGVE
ncbi:MAG: response regulator [Rhizomicrobium sp.]|jgi:DNA-binding response OmpR family regulator